MSETAERFGVERSLYGGFSALKITRETPQFFFARVVGDRRLSPWGRDRDNRYDKKVVFLAASEAEAIARCARAASLHKEMEVFVREAQEQLKLAKRDQIEAVLAILRGETP